MASTTSDNTVKKLSLTDSNVLKGIAILMMLCHHVFYSPDYGFTDIEIHGHGVINTFALMCKVCVAIFVFVSGYGLTEKYKDVEEIPLKKFYWDRFVKLYINYWFIWLIFVPISVLWLGPSLIQHYGNGNLLENIILDFCGIINWFGRYPYNPTWWFYSCIIGLYLLYPLLHKLAKKSTLYVVALGIAIYFLPSSLLMCVRIYVLTFICGILYSNYDILRKITVTPPLWSWAVLLIVLLVCRLKVRDSILYDALIVTVGVTAYQYVDGYIKTKRVLAYLGRYSMDMFLTHTFIFFLWQATHNIVYMTSNPLVIYMTVVALSLMLVLVIDKVKCLIGINQLVVYLRKRNS